MNDELDNLLHRWSGQTRLNEAELSTLLASIADPAPNPAAPWIAFWQQIGRLVRIEQQLGQIMRLPTT